MNNWRYSLIDGLKLLVLFTQRQKSFRKTRKGKSRLRIVFVKLQLIDIQGVDQTPICQKIGLHVVADDICLCSVAIKSLLHRRRQRRQ